MLPSPWTLLSGIIRVFSKSAVSPYRPNGSKATGPQRVPELITWDCNFFIFEGSLESLKNPVTEIIEKNTEAKWIEDATFSFFNSVLC